MAIGRLDDSVASLAELLGEMQPYEDFIFHHQYRVLSQALALSCRRRFDFDVPFFARGILNNVELPRFPPESHSRIKRDDGKIQDEAAHELLRTIMRFRWARVGDSIHGIIR
jgi:hypothetical protein